MIDLDFSLHSIESVRSERVRQDSVCTRCDFNQKQSVSLVSHCANEFSLGQGGQGQVRAEPGQDQGTP